MTLIAFWLVTLLHVVLLGCYRLLFWARFRRHAPDAARRELARAWGLGTRFDLRLALLLALPLLALSAIPGLSPAPGSGATVWWAYLVVAWAAITLLYLADVAHYDYLQVRLNASVVEHLDAPGVALRTAWESFPVLRGLALLAAAVTGYAVLVDALLSWIGARTWTSPGPLVGWALTVPAVLLGLHGRLAKYPLRWSQAFASASAFATALALNPVLFVYDTWANRRANCDLDLVRRHYGAISHLLGVREADPQALRFSRRVEPPRRREPPPNVVVVVLESFASYKVGAFGNALDPTPCFDAVARRSVLFERFFAVTSPTARAMFTLITGIPDVNAVHSASRNPMVVRQRTLINAFEGYAKMFFIGGSASWGNIRGVLSHNVPDLQIYEEGAYRSPRADGWGISDRNLFIEANEVFRSQERPFFSLLLASGNHRPWTIPPDHGGFVLRDVDAATLRANGFDSLSEFNSFRFMDYSLGELFRRAGEEEYGRRTIFIVLGDHGAGAPQETGWEKLGLTHVHTPLAIHCPELLAPAVLPTVVSSVDLLPTALGLAGLPYENTSFGRDAFEPAGGPGRVAFIRRPPHHLLLDDEFVYKLGPGQSGLYRHGAEDPSADVAGRFPDEAQRLRDLCSGILETSRFMLHESD